jgi:hypothetical protein
MLPEKPSLIIDLQEERLRRGMKRFHREPIQTWRRKAKLAVAGVCLVGLLAALLLIVLESTEVEPGGDSSESLFEEEVEVGPAWFTAMGRDRQR